VSGPSGGQRNRPPLDARASVRLMVQRGYAVPIQANAKAGYIIYEFLGGVYDGVKMRLYPPFCHTLTLGTETYVWSPPKNGRSARFTYRLQEST